MSNLDSILGLSDEKEGVVFFDMSQLMLASIFMNFKPEDEVNIDMLRHLFLDTIRSNINRFSKEYPNVVLATDNTSGGYWRRDIAWYYKRNRAKKRDASGYDFEKIFPMIHQLISEFSENLPRKVIHIEKVEADDIIAVLTKELSLQGHNIMIVSSDSDFTQLHKYKNVKQWSPMQKKLVKPKNGSAHADLMLKLIKGDQKDGVASIAVRNSYWADRIEGERAKSINTSWLKELTDAEDARTLLTIEQRVRFDENVQLLDFDAIPQEIVDKIKTEYYNETTGKKAKFFNYLVKHRCVKLLDEINTF